MWCKKWNENLVDRMWKQLKAQLSVIFFTPYGHSSKTNILPQEGKIRKFSLGGFLV